MIIFNQYTLIGTDMLRALSLITIALTGAFASNFETDRGVLERYAFEAFMENHNVFYTTIEEKLQRFQVFVENLKVIDTLNALGDGAEYGITKWADRTPEEFKYMFKGLGAVPGHSTVDMCTSDEPAETLPVDNLPAR